MASINEISAAIRNDTRNTLEETNPVIVSYIITKNPPRHPNAEVILVVLPTEAEVQTWTAAINTWKTSFKQTPISILALPASSTKEIQQTMQQVLSTHAQHTKTILITSEAALTSSIALLAEPLVVRVQDMATPSRLRSTLLAIGYTEEQQTIAPATFAIKGDVAFITTTTNELIRIDILGQAIEALMYNGNNVPEISIQANALSYKKSTVAAILDRSVNTIFSMEGVNIQELHPEHLVQLTIQSKGLRFDTEVSEQIIQKYETITKRKTKTKQHGPPRIDYTFLDSLKEEDFIVHNDHGIGQYKGRMRSTVDGIEKEYFVIEYANADKLFVPITYAGKLSKYVGAANPTIHRIGGAIWNQARRKVQQQCTNIARELAILYAKREHAKGFAFSEDTPQMIDFENTFPYTPTPDQHQAIEDVKHDMESETPMDRLICGDVGFGKTEIAMRAAFKATQDGKQVAVLAPTTILSQQHTDTFRKRFAKTGIGITQLSRFETERDQQHALKKIQDGSISIIIGTHRLLSKDVRFHNLGLLIIDEEQRFGVVHKEHFKKFRSTLDVLTLTATPIPRTLHMSVSGIRDISIIRTPPKKRKPVISTITPFSSSQIRRALQQEHNRNGQVYYLYNKVETIAAKRHELEQWLEDWDIKMNIGIAHGQLPEEQLSDVIQTFDQGKIDILLCSTIIQNGIDLANVNTIIIDNAPEFGLTQLYQLKGRVGRREKQGYAYFLYHANKLTPLARERLQALKEAEHLGAGFEIAMRDLEIRGTGNLLGREQSGNIAAVGIGLYSHMLEEAVNVLEDISQERIIETDATIDLPLSTFIPESFSSNTQEQLEITQTITQARDENDLEKRVQRLKSSYSTIPTEILNIITIVHINILANRNRIVNMTTSKQNINGNDVEALVIEFADPFTPEKVKMLLHASNHWVMKQEEKTAVIPLEDLGKHNWPTKIIQMLSIKNLQ